MAQEFFTKDDFKQLLLDGDALLDVRAPVEFLNSTIPQSFNIPLLNNDEREQVGIAYKESGQTEAIALGHRLVSGKTKADRISQWCQAITKKNCPALFCARGGMRSAIAQEWIEAEGVFIPRLKGGHKALRAFILQNLTEQSQQVSLLVLSGQTGVGKTRFLRDYTGRLKICDLEKLANHRGSAFGYLESGQPSQASFENLLGLDLLKVGEETKECPEHLLIEDESRFVGQVRLPDPLFQQMKQAPMVLLEAPLDARVELILDEYITAPLMQSGPTRQQERLQQMRESFPAATRRISKKLGGERTTIILSDMESAFKHHQNSNDPELHREWITKLLTWYYDPYYQRNIDKASERIVARGDRTQIQDYFNSLTSPTSPK